MLTKSDPARAKMLLKMAQDEVNERWQLYERMSQMYEQKPEDVRELV